MSFGYRRDMPMDSQRDRDVGAMEAFSEARRSLDVVHSAMSLEMLASSGEDYRTAAEADAWVSAFIEDMDARLLPLLESRASRWRS